MNSGYHSGFGMAMGPRQNVQWQVTPCDEAFFWEPAACLRDRYGTPKCRGRHGPNKIRAWHRKHALRGKVAADE